MLPLGHLVNVTVCALAIPADVFKVIDVLQGHGDAFETIGDFNRWNLQLHTTGLLEVGELGDFLPVKPDFPAKTPPGA